jgi:hypothetical protein
MQLTSMRLLDNLNVKTGATMNHYTYRITFKDGRQYIGVRSCKCEPENDTKYIGSSEYTKKLEIAKKEILGIFFSRQEAVANEIALHELYDVARSDLYLNRAKQTSTKFDTSGVSLVRSPSHNLKIKKALTGRKRSDDECEAISKGKLGKPRKPHTAETRQKQSESRKGIPGYKRGEKFDSDHHTLAYASRTKYSDAYAWQHDNGSECLSTCMEMGQNFGSGTKPTSSFRRVVKGEIKSSHGWKLKTQTV